MTRPKPPPPLMGEKPDSVLSTPLTGSCDLPLSGTADMKRVTAALREVILPCTQARGVTGGLNGLNAAALTSSRRTELKQFDHLMVRCSSLC